MSGLAWLEFSHTVRKCQKCTSFLFLLFFFLKKNLFQPFVLSPFFNNKWVAPRKELCSRSKNSRNNKITNFIFVLFLKANKWCFGLWPNYEFNKRCLVKLVKQQFLLFKYQNTYFYNTLLLICIFITLK